MCSCVHAYMCGMCAWVSKVNPVRKGFFGYVCLYCSSLLSLATKQCSKTAANFLLCRILSEYLFYSVLPESIIYYYYVCVHTLAHNTCTHACIHMMSPGERTRYGDSVLSFCLWWLPKTEHWLLNTQDRLLDWHSKCLSLMSHLACNSEPNFHSFCFILVGHFKFLWNIMVAK